MKVVNFRDIDHETWDSVATLSPHAWLTHTSAWVKIEERFFIDANLSFALVDKDQAVGIQPLFLSDGTGMAFGERLLHSGIHRHTGLALAADIGNTTKKAIRRAAMKEILALADLYDVDRIQLNSHNLAPVNRSGDREEIPFWVKEFGFQLGIAFGPTGMTPCPGVSTVNADQLVDLDVSEEALFANLDDRASVRQANKNGLEFEISDDPSALQHYVAIAKASARRTSEALPSSDYYQSVFDAFLPEGGIHIAFARKGAERLAGLLLLTGKKAANYLAGVSLPEALRFRPNDFLHWNSILWAKRSGLATYRFGPWFPEVPREWPISKVSHFKTKFGSKSVPILQGSLFRRPELYIGNLAGSSDHLKQVANQRTVSADIRESGAAFIAHHLGIFGFPQTAVTSDSRPIVLYRPSRSDLVPAREALDRGLAIVAILPSVEFAVDFGVTIEPKTVESAQVLHAKFAGAKPWKRLRTLHSYMRFKASSATPIVLDSEGRMVWFQQAPGGSASIVFVGTDMASDLLRYRQGDPLAAKNRPTDAKWGIAGERPNYLFDAQLTGEDPGERPVDWWCETLADALVRFCDLDRLPILPNGAPGAIVVTGDDDQAPLARYAQQRTVLGQLPISYFLHPLTKHTTRSLSKLKSLHRVELGLHPDALDQPDRYPELFAEQFAWFSKLTGSRARLVRNHGFLNDGYWEHAKAWNTHGVEGSSNLPGFDGRILNGSLLPARLMLEGELTDHWSMLTAIGDGIVFVNGWDDRQSADCIHRLADRIHESGIPGIIVLNLHPENVEKTQGMHEAAKSIVESGFVSWTLGECFDWFRKRDIKPAANTAFFMAKARELRRRRSIFSSLSGSISRALAKPKQ